MPEDVDAMHFSYAVRCEPRQMSPTRLIIGGRLSPRRKTSRMDLIRGSLNITSNIRL